MAVDKKNIFLSETVEPLGYTSLSKPGSKAIPDRDPIQHAIFLKSKFEEAFKQSLTEKQVAAIKYKNGTYLEFIGQENHDLVVKSLEDVRAGIRLLNVKTDDGDKSIHATVYIPAGKESHFLKKVEAYATEQTKNGQPKNKDLINSIENIRLAVLETFWIGKKDDLPGPLPTWCEVWLRTEDNIEEANSKFTELCEEQKIACDTKAISFPERLVKLIRATSTQLSELIRRCDNIAEFRRAPEATIFFDSMTPAEQKDWADNLLSRVHFSFNNNVSICLLDTGLNSGHQLLAPAVDDDTCQVVETEWSENDTYGHGTEMAGIALYNDLKDKTISQNEFTIAHKIESVKILPSKGENDPKLYGSITQNAVYLAEIARPNSERAICMAVTSNLYTTGDGTPSSWSGAVDSLASGASGDKKKRLMFISAGNVEPRELQDGYPTVNKTKSVENPGQAWNAITVGAYSNDIRIDDPALIGYHPVADSGELSPYSSSSVMWDKKWPIKPEILCDGGNVATDDTNFTECADLSLLTTNFRPFIRSFSTIWGTSAATAQAAWMAAQIMDEYPGIWPETVRALMVHSARWTDKMKAQFCIPDRKTTGRKQLLRTCGYGIPDLVRANQCANNSVNMIIEGELQPFNKEGMNEMHLHKVPWPHDVLLALGETPAEMRVTLSYFIEPGPGEIGWKDKYRYQSCALRFDVINKNETEEDFKKRINVQMRGEDKKDSGEGTSGSDRWYLGSDNRDVGSIHSDFMVNQTAADLCDAKIIAVYPVIGWWRERSHLKRYNSKIRYSFVVSLSTPSVKTDLYTPIITQIAIKNKELTTIEISRNQ